MKKLLSILCGIMLLVACTEVPAPMEPKEEVNMLEGKVLHFAVAEDIEDIDAQKVTSIPSFTILYHLVEGLVRERNGEILPGMAKYWEISADRKVYRFYLRDAYWQDGIPITADQFVNAFQRLVDPKVASDYAFIAFPIQNAQKVYEGILPKEDLGVTAIDSSILEIVLENPTNYFLESLGTMPHFSPIRNDYLGMYGESYGSDEERMAYNGPFVMQAWNKGEK